MSTRRVDVVVVAKDDATNLRVSLKCAFQHIPIHNLIMVVGDSSDDTLEVAQKYGNIVIQDDGKGVGFARDLGLKRVETPFYVSLDSDVLINADWYRWCSKTIKKPHVAACEGFPIPIGSNYAKHLLKRASVYCSLGNTWLKTNVIRETGMPYLQWGEDYVLKEKLVNKGYEWLTNFSTGGIHLINDMDGLRHHVKYGKSITFAYGVSRIINSLKPSNVPSGDSFKDINVSIYEFIMNLALCYGSLLGKSWRLRRTFSHARASF